MSRSKVESVGWVPIGESGRKRVQDELAAILSSHHFRNSKRYPSLLRYVVEKTLNGESDQLKERTLGIEVFDRRPDYDTGLDPVVRSSASEVRRRLAQYYHEAGDTTELHIELPLGSYAPVFHISSPTAEFSANGSFENHPVAERADQTPGTSAESALPGIAASAKKPGRSWASGAICLLLIAVCCVGWIVVRRRMNTTAKVWNPILQTPGPVMIVVGSGSLELTEPEPPQTSLFNHMIGPYHHISIASSVAISRVAGTLEAHSKDYVIKEARATSLADLQGRSVILVEALNNEWTLRLCGPLRFTFAPGPMAHIEDRKNPGSLAWAVDFTKPYTSISTDYGIVARYRDAETNGYVMIVAGLGPYGTEAASEAVTTPVYLDQFTSQLPSGWQSKNFEMVIRTSVIDSEPGPPELVAKVVW
jgi:hypothetical protein